MSKTTKRKIGNGLFAVVLGILGCLAALPAFAQDAALPVDVSLPLPALIVGAAAGITAIVRMIRGGFPIEDHPRSKQITVALCVVPGIIAGALGLCGSIGAGLPGQVFAGIVAASLAYTGAGAAGPKARLES